MLCEAKLIHLMKSKIFFKYFNTESLTENEEENISSFYIMEEDSIFNIPP